MPTARARIIAVLRALACITLVSTPALTQVPASERAALIARADSLRAVAVTLSRDGEASAPLAVSAFRAEIAVQEQLGAASRLREIGTAWNLLGHVYHARAQYDSAEAVYRRARAVRQEAGDLDGVAASTNNIGNVHLSLDRLDSALVYYQRARELWKARGNAATEALVIRNMALVHRDSAARVPAMRGSAMALLHQALALHRSLGDSAEPEQHALALEDIGTMHDLEARTDSAMAYWRASLDVLTQHGIRRRESNLRFGIGALHDYADRLDSAHHQFELAAAAAMGDRDVPMQAAALHRIGGLYTQRGESDSAVVFLEAAIGLARAAGDSARVGDYLLSLARERRFTGRFALAAEHLDAALRAHRAGNDRDGEAAVLEELGRYFDRTGRRDSAVVRLNEALAIRRAVGDTIGHVNTLVALGQALSWRHPDEVRRMADSARAVYAEARTLAAALGQPRIRGYVARSLAAFHNNLGARDSARVHAREALTLDRLTGNVLGESSALRLMGRTFSDADSALTYFDSALVVAKRVGGVSDQRVIHAEAGELLLGATDSSGHRRVAESIAHLERALGLARRMAQPLDESRALEFIGHAYKLWTPARWADAAAYYDSSWTVLERLREQAGDDAARIAFAEQHGNASRHLYAAWTQRARETGAQADLRRALAAAERGRARGLLDLRGGAAHAFVAGPLDRVADTLIAHVARPGLAALAYFVGADTTTATLLRASGEIVEYAIPITTDTVIAMIAGLRRALDVDSAAVRAAPAAMEAAAPGPARGLGLGVAAPGAEAPEIAASLQRVSEYLLPAALRDVLRRDGVVELVLVTDGPLALVPFAALPFDTAGTPLGIALRLRLTPSLAVLAEVESRPAVAARAAAVVVGNPAMPVVHAGSGASMQLSSLPGAASEADAVAQALGTTAQGGSAATESRIRLQMPSASVIHLATHGYAYASEHRVRDSFVALAPGGGEDGLLTVGEVLDELPGLRADLIVLSACQTALGNSTNTEGTVGLQRAFLARGARSLLVSLWSVDDAVTERMMIRFYHHWLGGSSKSEALRQAQADIRATHPNPRFWAAFQLVGAA